MIGAVRLIGLVLLIVPGAAWAGAWTLPFGQGQVTISGLVSEATRAYDGARDGQPTPRYRKFETQALIEYGLSDTFTLMLAPGLQHIDIAAPTDARRSGVGYTEFGGRYRILQLDGWVFSAQTLLRVPGTSQSSNPAAIGYTDPEVDMRALAGKSFTLGGLPAFVNFEAAHRFRAGEPPNEFRLDATFAIQPAPRWWLLTQSFNVISEGEGGPQFPSYDYSKLQLSAVYELSKLWSVQFGGYATVSGRNALKENGLVFGLWRKF